MIAFIKGTVAEAFSDHVIIENQGIGYSVLVPATVLDRIPSAGTEVKLHTYMHVREDAMQLYGFLTREDMEIFKLLLGVSGIGPKGALAVLSTITPDDLRFAVLSGDVKTISKAPGIGGKTAQRLIIELKDKLKLEDAWDLAARRSEEENESIGQELNSVKQDAIAALVALGYGAAEAAKAVQTVELSSQMSVEAMLKAALKQLGRM